MADEKKGSMRKLLQQKVATKILDNQIGLKTEGGAFRWREGFYVQCDLSWSGRAPSDISGTGSIGEIIEMLMAFISYSVPSICETIPNPGKVSAGSVAWH